MVAARPDPASDRAASADVITACRTTLAERRDQLRAAAVVAEVRLSEDGHDAIRVEFEHTDGPALTVLVPYSKKRFGRIDYGHLRAADGTRHIWLD
jgi:hypothetical protein